MEKKQNTVRIVYGNDVTVLPMKAAEVAERASGLDFKILMYITHSGQSEGVSFAAIAEEIGCAESDVDRSVAFWCGAGVLEGTASVMHPEKKRGGRPKKQTPEETVQSEAEKRGIRLPSERQNHDASAASSVSADGKKLRRADALPQYTTEELSALLEKRKNLTLFVDECQRAFGKMFNPHEISKIVGLLEYLSLDEAYVLMLLRYFGEMPEAERKSLHYVERMAFSLTDDGITTVEALEIHLHTLKKVRDSESHIRSIFGMGARAFSAKERAAILRWLGEMDCSMELIELAYERTVNAVNKPSIAYASKILERWHSEGLKTPQDVENAENGARSEENFETNDFFEAALKNAYGSDYTPPSDAGAGGKRR